MELHEYPRPANDTGIGIHWAPGYASAVSIGRIREYWLPEMRALGVKWVKIYNHDSALDFAELLLAEGFMPIVRIYRAAPNPARLGVKEVVHLDALIRAGVRYFEFNNEPDQDAEWQGGRKPANALPMVVENTIANLELILERGGMPGLPALSGSSQWDLVGKIVAAGRRDLLDGPVWQAVHNYPRNRPLDFPYDIGNQEGAAYTERFYRAVAEEPWGENAWRGRTLQEVNRLRRGRSTPGATMADDHDCWLAYTHFDEMNRRHLGRSLPILSTETGYIVGEDVDPRYPATTPDLHMAQTLEACRIMMGTSRRFDPAPDYYFCTAFWLLANGHLGSNSSWWEGHAWYSDHWPGGVLPIVHALRAEPKAIRKTGDPAEQGRHLIEGTVLQAGEHRTLVLRRDGDPVARVTLDAGNRYRIPELAPGDYTLHVEETDIRQAVALTEDKPRVVVNFDLSSVGRMASKSMVSGMVQGGANALIMLTRASDGEEWVALARDDGSFRFIDLPPGTYTARVHPHGSMVDEIRLDGRNDVEIELAAAGWGHVVRHVEDPNARHLGAIRCVVQGESGVPVFAGRDGEQSHVVHTGDGSSDSPYSCELAPLDVGDYILQIGQGETEQWQPPADFEPLQVRVSVDKKRIPVVIVSHLQGAAVEPDAASSVQGRVVGANGDPLEIHLLTTEITERTAQTDVDGAFRFGNLPPGRYIVQVAGYDDQAARSEFALDGRNQVTVELVLPEPAPPESPEMPRQESLITGVVPILSDGVATLIDTVGNEYTRTVTEQGAFAFTNLPAETYRLRVEGGYVQDGLQVDGANGMEILFSPLAARWEAEVSNAGSMPGYSVLRVEVEGSGDDLVRIWQHDGEEQSCRIGDIQRNGVPVAEFGPLEEGDYMVKPDQVDALAHVELNGLDAKWVSFRQRWEPIHPHLVRTLPPAEVAERAAEDPPTPAPERHYLWIGSGISDERVLDKLLRYVLHHRPWVGADENAALNARYVTVVGQIESELEDRFEQAGIAVSYFSVSFSGLGNNRLHADDEI